MSGSLNVGPTGGEKSLHWPILQEIMNHLDDKDLVKIFSVSTAWKKAACANTLKRYFTYVFTQKLSSTHRNIVTTLIDTISTHIFNKETDAHKFKRVLHDKAENYLQRLDLTQLSAAEIKHVVKNLPDTCNQVEFIDLTNVKIDDKTLQLLLKKCPNLKELHLENSLSLKGTGIERLGEYCPRLEILDLNGTLVDHSHLIKAIQGLSHLRKVELSSTDVDTNFIDELTKNNPNIEFLNLLNCENIQDQSLDFIAQRALKLKELDISNCKQVSDTGIGKITAHSKHIKKLSFEFCKAVTSPMIQKVKQQFPSAQIIHS